MGACDFTGEEGGETLYGRAYLTVINGQTICVTLVSRSGGISDGLANAVKETVDNIKLTKVSSTMVDDFIAVYASLAGAAAGALIGAAVMTVRKRRAKVS